MKVAYFSPLSPLKSGISDYSEELIPYLSKRMDIVLFIDNFKPSNPILKNYVIKDISDFNESEYKKYDCVIYHMGNNHIHHENIYKTCLKYPGIVVIHDYSIHHLIANLFVAKNDYAGYINEMIYNYGKEGEIFARDSLDGKTRVMWETDKTIQYPANRRMLDNSYAVIVHSQFIKKCVKSVRSDIPVKYAPLPASDVVAIDNDEKKQLRRKYNIPENKIVLASFGYISAAKRIDKILNALRKLKDEFSDFIYLMVGEEERGVYEMSKYAKTVGIKDFARYIGFVTLNEFKDYIKLTDICINLRYPTQGETSASLLRILGMGKPVVVTNIGTFTDFPEQCCIKIRYDHNEEDDIYNAVKKLVLDDNLRRKMADYAIDLIAKNHTIENTASKYHELITEIIEGRVFEKDIDGYKSLFDSVADSLMSVGLSNNEGTVTEVSEKIVSLISK